MTIWGPWKFFYEKCQAITVHEWRDKKLQCQNCGDDAHNPQPMEMTIVRQEKRV